MEPEPEPNSNITVQLILIIVLILINAFFAAAEMALVSLNKNKIKTLADGGNKRAKSLEKLVEEPTKFLSTVQVGITMAGFFSSAFAATGLSNQFAAFLSKYNIPYTSQVSLVVITIALSYFTLVFGELFPKRIALQKSETIAMLSVVPILYVSKVVRPFASLLTMSTNLLSKITGLGKNNSEEKVSEDEIKCLVEIGQEDGTINETEKDMINSIFDFNDKVAREIMTPRTDVFMIDINVPVSELLDELLEEKYARIPVYNDDKDNIIGILYMKDFIIEAKEKGFDNVDISKILHVPYFVQESKKIDVLFKKLQTSKNHMALLIDEYGGFEGIVTIEDIVEEIMGEIEDEYDDEEPEFQKIDDNTYVVKGLLPLDDLNDHLDLNLVSEKCDTVGGFLVSLMGSIPKIGEEKTVEYENVVFKIEEVKEKRIEKIKIYITNKILQEC
jgi:putative hemolysin